jgi:signal transduction histidine kinase
VTTAFMTGRVSRSVAWRLAAVVLPSVLAVVLVAGLFYYGELGREAPRVTLIVAAALTLASVAMAWLNATYFAERLSRLARVTGQDHEGSGRTDEFDRIERAVGNLGSALSAAEREKARSDAIAAARLHDQATMLAGVVSDSIAQLDQVRLPLQILLESPFGELNENQEELLRDARAAADAIDTALRRLGQVADIDRDAFVSQQELVQVNDVVRSVLPLARAAADRRGARTQTELEPGLPRVVADRARLAEALSLFVTDASSAAGPAAPLRIATMRDGGGGAFIRIAPVGTAAQSTSGGAAGDDARGPSSNEPALLGGATSSFLVASRLVGAQGGEVAIEGDELTLRVGRR